jgi:DNA-directed RNA polymerase specialized sigma24 family protein
MLTILVMVNAACLAAALAVAARVWRPADGPDDTHTFATVLAALRSPASSCPPRDAGCGSAVVSSVLSPRAVRADEDNTEGGEDVVGLPLRQRMAILRCMLQGKSVEETATLVQATLPVVHALFRLHARGKTVVSCS